MTFTQIILLPGLDGTGELFQRFISAAPKTIALRPIAYPNDLASYDELEPWVRDQLSDSCVILAESFSGPLAVRIASDPRVRSLVLCNSFVSPPRSRALQHLVFPFLFRMPPPKRAIKWLLLGDGAPPDLLAKVQATIARIPAEVIAARIRQVLSCNERESLRKLGKPLIYLRGVNDLLVRERSWQEISSLHNDAKRLDIRGPHMLLQVEPEQCWSALLRILRESAAV